MKVLFSLTLLIFASMNTASQFKITDVDPNCFNNEECEMVKVEEVAMVIREKIQNNWAVEQSQRDFSAEVVFILNEKRVIESIEMVQASGDELFDRSVITAIESLFPFDEMMSLNKKLFEKHFKESRIHFVGSGK